MLKITLQVDLAQLSRTVSERTAGGESVIRAEVMPVLTVLRRCSQIEFIGDLSISNAPYH